MLSDETKRQQYNNFGTTDQMGGMGRGPFGRPPPKSNQAYEQHWEYQSTIDPEDLFRKIFGNNAFKMDFSDDFAESNYGFGAAQDIIMKISFTQAAKGGNKEVRVNVVDVCQKCGGSRCELGYKPVKCVYCDGTGFETVNTGPFVMRSTCRYCNGSRMYIKYKCTECEGKGQNVQRKVVSVPIPPGVEDGQTVRLSVGNRRELFVTFRVEKSNYYRRDGADVHTEAGISLSQALLGGVIRVQGLYEDHTIQIEPGTSSHQRIRLPGKGMKKANKFGTGDHYVHLKIEVPSKLNPKQFALIAAYAELEENTPGHINGISKTKDGKFFRMLSLIFFEIRLCCFFKPYQIRISQQSAKRYVIRLI